MKTSGHKGPLIVGKPRNRGFMEGHYNASASRAPRHPNARRNARSARPEEGNLQFEVLADFRGCASAAAQCALDVACPDGGTFGAGKEYSPYAFAQCGSELRERARAESSGVAAAAVALLRPIFLYILKRRTGLGAEGVGEAANNFDATLLT